MGQTWSCCQVDKTLHQVKDTERDIIGEQDHYIVDGVEIPPPVDEIIQTASKIIETSGILKGKTTAVTSDQESNDLVLKGTNNPATSEQEHLEEESNIPQETSNPLSNQEGTLKNPQSDEANAPRETSDLISNLETTDQETLKTPQSDELNSPHEICALKMTNDQEALDVTMAAETPKETVDLKKYAIQDEQIHEFLKVSPNNKKKKIKSPLQAASPSLSPLKTRISPLNYTMQDPRTISPEHPRAIRLHNSAETTNSPDIRLSRNERNLAEANEPRSDSVSSKSSTSSINTISSSVSSSKHRVTEIWEPDHVSTSCRVCSVQFGILNRKHHCRKW
jgi:hypothetical protein